MYCRSCDTQLADGAVACTKCGKAPYNGKEYCPNCGKPTGAEAIMCVGCGASLSHGGLDSLGVGQLTQTSRLVVGLAAILFGYLGVHKFLLGYIQEGAIMLVCTLLLAGGTLHIGGIGGSVVGIIGVIEGIIYLTKSDQEFQNTYVTGKKPWF